VLVDKYFNNNFIKQWEMLLMLIMHISLDLLEWPQLLSLQVDLILNRLKPELIMKSVVPVVMAGILGIYGMIVAVIIYQKSRLFVIQFIKEAIVTMTDMLILLLVSVVGSVLWLLDWLLVL
jgi:hypothetical protein